MCVFSAPKPPAPPPPPPLPPAAPAPPPPPKPTPRPEPLQKRAVNPYVRRAKSKQERKAGQRKGSGALRIPLNTGTGNTGQGGGLNP